MENNELLTYDNVNFETIFDEMERNDDWLGFGYIGERHHIDYDKQFDADVTALEAAISAELTYGELFE